MTAETHAELMTRFGLHISPVAAEEVILTPVRSGRTVTLASSPPVGVYHLAGGTGPAVAPRDAERQHTVFGGVLGHGWTLTGWNGQLEVRDDDPSGASGPSGRRSLAATFDDRFGGIAFTHWPALEHRSSIRRPWYRRMLAATPGSSGGRAGLSSLMPVADGRLRRQLAAIT